MILKSIGRTGAFKNLINYMLNDDHLLRDAKGDLFVVRRNVLSMDPYSVIAEFEANDAHRIYRGKNAARFNHIIISWHESDKERLNEATIREIANKYISLRGDKAMFWGVVHNAEHPHLHMLMSASEAETGISTRISKARFNELRRELQAFESEKFPELAHSAVNYDERSNAPSDKEWQMQRRTGEKGRKEQLKETVEAAYAAATSREDFYSTLTQQGLDLYARSGDNIQGVDDGNRHYRFSTLLGKERLDELDRRDDRTHDMQQFRNDSEQKDLAIDDRLANPDRMKNEQNDVIDRT